MTKKKTREERAINRLALQLERTAPELPLGAGRFSFGSTLKPKKKPAPELSPTAKRILWNAAVGILKRNAATQTASPPLVYGVAELRAAYPGAA